MVVGSSGLGKTTFLMSLCNSSTPIFDRPNDTPEMAAVEKTVSIESKTVEFNNGKFTIELTLIDTPGFGDSIDNEKNFLDILKYIESLYDNIMIEESRIRRNPRIQDCRVHALIYFISPTGHSLKEMDIRFMSLVGKRINVIPVIAKADSLTPNELSEFKGRINDEIQKHRIPIYDMPLNEDECEGDALIENSELRNLRPFAIISSVNTKKLPDGTVIHCREYPWGTVNIDDENHCDLIKLKTVLFRTDLYTLREVTHTILYEQYRTERLSSRNENTLLVGSQEDSVFSKSEIETSASTSNYNN